MDLIVKVKGLDKNEYHWGIPMLSNFLLVPETLVELTLQNLISKSAIEGEFGVMSPSGKLYTDRELSKMSDRQIDDIFGMSFSLLKQMLEVRCFIATWPSKKEVQTIREFIKQINVSIPVPINRIAEKTGLVSERCERIIKELITENPDAGNYLALEGVFIKTEGSIAAFDSLLKRKVVTAGEMSGIPFFCQIDGESHPATDKAYQYMSCKRFVCSSCFNDLLAIERTNYPMCDGFLQPFTASITQ